MRAPSKKRPKRAAPLSRALSDAVFGNVDLFALIVEYCTKGWDCSLRNPPEPPTQTFPVYLDGLLPLPCVGQGHPEHYCDAWRSAARLSARNKLRMIGVVQNVNKMGDRVGLIAEGRVLTEVHLRVRASRHEMAMALALYTQDLISGDLTSTNRFHDPSDHIEELIYDRCFRTSQSSMSDGIDLKLLISNIIKNDELPQGRQHIAIRKLTDYIYQRHLPTTAQELDAALGGKCLLCLTKSGKSMTCKLCKSSLPSTSQSMISVEYNGYASKPYSSTTAQFDMPWCGEYRIKSGGDHGANGAVVPFIHKCVIDLQFTSALHLVTIQVEVDRTNTGVQECPTLGASLDFAELFQGCGDLHCNFKIVCHLTEASAPASKRTSAENDAFYLFASQLRNPENFRSLARVFRALADVYSKSANKEFDEVRATMDRGTGVLPLNTDRVIFRMSLPVLTHGFIESLIPQALFARRDAPCSVADMLCMSNEQATDAIRAEREREKARAEHKSRAVNGRREMWLHVLVDALRRDPALGPFWRNAPIGATDDDLNSYYVAKAPISEPAENKLRGFWCPNTDLLTSWRININGKHRNVGRALVKPVELGKDAGRDLQALFQWLNAETSGLRRKRFVECALYHFRSLHTVLRPIPVPTVARVRTIHGRMLDGISTILKRLWKKQAQTHRPTPLQPKSATSSEWDLQSLKLNNPNIVLGLWIKAMLDDAFTIQIEATHVFERIHTIHVSADSKGPFRPKPEDYRYPNNGALGVGLTLSAYTGESSILSSENLRIHFVIPLPCLPTVLGWYSGYEPRGLLRIKQLLSWHDHHNNIVVGGQRANLNVLDEREKAFFGPANRREWLLRAKKACEIATDSFHYKHLTFPEQRKLRRLYALEQILRCSWIKMPAWGPSLGIFELEDVNAAAVQSFIDIAHCPPTYDHPGHVQRFWNEGLFWLRTGFQTGFHAMRARTRIRPNATEKIYDTFEPTPMEFCKVQGFKTYCRCTARCAMSGHAFGEGAELRQQTLQFGPFHRGRRTFTHMI